MSQMIPIITRNSFSDSEGTKFYYTVDCHYPVMGKDSQELTDHHWQVTSRSNSSKYNLCLPSNRIVDQTVVASGIKYYGTVCHIRFGYDSDLYFNGTLVCSNSDYATHAQTYMELIVNKVDFATTDVLILNYQNVKLTLTMVSDNYTLVAEVVDRPSSSMSIVSATATSLPALSISIYNDFPLTYSDDRIRSRLDQLEELVQNIPSQIDKVSEAISKLETTIDQKIQLLQDQIKALSVTTYLTY